MTFGSAAAGYEGLPQGLEPETSLARVWSHLETCLATLPLDLKLASPKTNENDITYALVDALSAPPGDRPFYFVPEPPQPKSRARVDLDVRLRDGQAVRIEGMRFGARNTFLVLEAKRLPAPEKRRWREYLVGEGGGIQRFKQGDHGRRLQVVGMLGYIQCFDASHWQTTLNAWIDELIVTPTPGITWDADDRLMLESASPDHPVTTLHSFPLRKIDGQRLTMRHLWVQLCPPNPAPVE
jgi:hypothetical protein